jgi:phosphatidylglycerophosphate synthase
MVLHELHKRAEWYPLSDAERTPVQRLAARTQGVLTPANVVSLLGAAITITGLILFYRQQYASGLIIVGVGRICDILDGHLARHTHTTSPFGEGLDAGFDKLVVLVAVYQLVLGQVLPVLFAVALLLVQLVIVILALAVRRDGTGLHPTRIGKYAMFGLWIGIGSLMLAHVLPAGSWAKTTRFGAFLIITIALVGQLEALREYWRAARQKLFGRG